MTSMRSRRGWSVGVSLVALTCLLGVVTAFVLTHRSSSSAVPDEPLAQTVYFGDGEIFTPKSPPTDVSYLSADEA
jgi:hypothetical protein